VIDVTITTTGGAKAFLVDLTQEISDRREFHEVLANRLRDELVDHFRAKNATPNRLGGKRTNFWNDIADATGVKDVRDDGATVTVAERRINIHLFGGTIVPKKAKALTIPLVAAAHGESVASYQTKYGSLFAVRGKNALFEKTGDSIRAVFALRRSVKIPRDPDALPTDDALRAALAEEAEDYLAALNAGGAA
jgi:hypothetical protein